MRALQARWKIRTEALTRAQPIGGTGLHGGSVMRRLQGAGDIGWGSYRPRTVEETVAGQLVAHAGFATPFLTFAVRCLLDPGSGR